MREGKRAPATVTWIQVDSNRREFLDPGIHRVRHIQTLLAVQYALSGEGIVLVDTNLFSEDLRAGRLVQPFDIALDEGYGYYLIIHPEALSDAAVALFRSWLIERFGIAPSAAARAGSALA